jgi:hypothetical protein
LNDSTIPPALSAEEWAKCIDIQRGGGDPLTYAVLADPAKAMAWINATIPNRHPVKITRERVERLHAIADALRETIANEGAKAFLHEHASALAALLPPEVT